MNILVTGGAGYVGAALVNQLFSSKEIDSVTVYDNLSRKNYNFFTSFKFESSKLKFIEGDILDTRKLKAALKNIDVVYHLAALTDKNPSLDSHLFEQVNNWGTSELVNAIEESNVSKLIYLSSTAIYGEGTSVFNEESEPKPVSFYATSKWRGEAQVQRLFSKKKCLILRAGNIYGFSPCLRFDSVINKFMFEANFKGRIQIHGNGRQTRPYIHINQVVDTLVRFLTIETDSTVINLSAQNLQILDIVEHLQAIYPQLEFIFINQHLKIEDLIIENGLKLQTYVPAFVSDLSSELEAFKQHLSF
jgi:UDP-glucose 4-epimerase